MATNPSGMALINAISQNLSDSDLPTLCSYLQSADYRFANLNCASLPSARLAAAVVIVSYCAKQNLTPVLLNVLRLYYPNVLANAPAANASAANPSYPAADLATLFSRYVTAPPMARRNVSVLGCVLSLIIVLVVGGAITFFVASSIGFSPTFINQPVGRSDSLNAIYMLSPNDGWIVGQTYVEDAPNDALLLHYDGSRWNKLPSPAHGELDSLYMVSPSEGWAVGQQPVGESYGSLILHYHNGTWSKEENADQMILKAVFMVAADEGWAAGEDFGNTVLQYTGGRWQPFKLGGNFPYTINGIYMVARDKGWMVGEAGTILAYDGASWQPQQSNTERTLTGVHMISASEGWAVGEQGDILHYQNGAWAKVDSPTQTDLTGVYMTSASEGWATGANGVMLHYQNGAWTKVSSSGMNGDLSTHGLSMLSSSSGWAVAEFGNLLRYQDGAWKSYYSN